MWTLIFLVAFLAMIAAVIGLLLGLIRPTLVKMNKRSESALVFSGLFLISLTITFFSVFQTQPEVTVSTQSEVTEAFPPESTEIPETQPRLEALDIVGIGGSLESFRERFGQESSVIQASEGMILGANFGDISASFVNGVCQGVQATEERDLSSEEALSMLSQFLPTDANVLTPLYKGVYASESLKDVDSYTLVQTYFSESLAALKISDDYPEWKTGSIQASLAQDPDNPEKIALWTLSMDEPNFLDP